MPDANDTYHGLEPRYWRIGERSAHLKLSRETVRKLVQHLPGVLRIKLGPRQSHVTYVIPHSVVVRLLTRLTTTGR